MTAAEKARDYAESAQVLAPRASDAECAVVYASLAAAWASLAVVEELGRFEAVAVEPRELTPEERHVAEGRYGTYAESVEAREAQA